MKLLRSLVPVVAIVAALFFASGLFAPDADARSKSGGKSFSMGSPAPKAPPAAAPGQKGSMATGMAGGLLGGALGGLLLGSMLGGGQGMGLLPLLLLAGVGYFLYRRFKNAQSSGQQPLRRDSSFPIPPIGGGAGQAPGYTAAPPPPPAASQQMTVEEGLAQIRQHDRYFDAPHFLEVASDVFFQVQAGWMRRDLDSYRHLLGSELAEEYAGHFAEMRAKGVINKLESIAIRKVDIVAAGSDGREDFVTVLFTANLLDYTVNDTSGELVEGSMEQPVKFAEEWTWARPVNTDNWKLEGIKTVNG